MKQSRDGLRQKRLTGTGRTEHKNVALLKLQIRIGFRGNSLIMIVHCYREYLLGILLTDHILIQESFNLLWLAQLQSGELCCMIRIVELLFQELCAEIHTLVTDKYILAVTRDQLLHLILGLSAE